MNSRARCLSLRLVTLAAGACVLYALDAEAGSSRAAIAVSARVAPSCSFAATSAGALDVRCSSGALGNVTLATAPASLAAASTGFVPVKRAADESARGSCAFVLLGRGVATAPSTTVAGCTPAPASSQPVGAAHALEASIVF